MADVFLILSVMFGIFSLIGFIASFATPYTSNDKSISIVAGTMLMLCLIVGIWSGNALNDYNPTPTVLVRPIEYLKDVVPFYFDENNKPVEITGDGRFADPKTTVVLIKTYPGGWKYGIYVSGWRKVEFAKKSEVEK